MKKGLSDVVATVIVILVVIAAIAILAAAFVPFFGDRLGDAQSCIDKLNTMQIARTQYTCVSNSFSSFSIQKVQENQEGFIVILETDQGREKFEINGEKAYNNLRLASGDFNQPLTIPQIGGSATYVFSGVAHLIEIYPVASDQICSLIDSAEFNACSAEITELFSVVSRGVPTEQPMTVTITNPVDQGVYNPQQIPLVSFSLSGGQAISCSYQVKFSTGQQVTGPIDIPCSSPIIDSLDKLQSLIPVYTYELIVSATNDAGTFQDSILFSFEIDNGEVETAICGNSIVEQEEQCDDGNTLDTDACSNQCTFTYSISNNGVTWGFDKQYQTGQFITGEYWVKPLNGENTVTIIGMDPAFKLDRNGWEIDPKKPSSGPWPQSFDGRVQYDSTHGPYIAPTIAPNIAQPLVVTVNSLPKSVVKGVSINPSGACQQDLVNDGLACISEVSVLTIVPDTPPTDAFRPPYLGNIPSKFPYRTLSEIDIDAIPTVNAVSNTPTIQSQIDRISSGAALDHYSSYFSPLIPRAYPRYGAGISNWNNGIAMRILVNPAQPAGETQEKREELIIKFTQYTIDEWAMVQAGLMWTAAGGHGQGRLLPILWYATVFDDSAAQQKLSSMSPDQFGEISANLYETTTEVNVYGEEVTSGTCNTGILEVGYWHAHTGLKHACSTMRDPYLQIDGGKAPGEDMSPFPYQSCCSSQQWVGTSTVMKIFGNLQASVTDDDINHFYSYTERWYDFGRYTQPDSCAPVMGVCVGGFNDGNTCTFANNVGYAGTFYNKNCSTGPGQPGKCLTGICESGPYQGEFCGFKNGPAACNNYGQCCGAGINCVPNPDYYEVTYGPLPGNEEPKQCITDNDPSDGIGRFPQLHNTGANAGWNNADTYEKFLDAMSVTYGVVDDLDWDGPSNQIDT